MIKYVLKALDRDRYIDEDHYLGPLKGALLFQSKSEAREYMGDYLGFKYTTLPVNVKQVITLGNKLLMSGDIK